LAKRKNNTEAPEASAATVGYEAQLWQMADALRGSMDAAEYKHVVLGLIFLKYISDAFEEQHAKLVAEQAKGAKAGSKPDISIYGQESNYTTWRLAKMNLAIRGIDGQIAHGDTFHADRHPDLKADFILANPPFNISDWGGERLAGDKRWQYGAPPKGNANFAWVQHIVHHLAPAGVAGFVLANGSMSSNQSGEGEIRKHLIETDLVDCMVALPGQLFYSTPIPACLWFLARDRKNGKFRDRRGQVLFIDARKLGPHGGPHPPRADRRRHRPDRRHLPRLAGREGRG